MAGNGNVDSLSEYLASAIGIAREAGDVIRRGFNKSKHVDHNGLVDLVTEIENTCEKLIFNHIKQLYPTHKLLVEKETTHDCGTTELTDEATWIVNPLDGTTNFVHGYPFVCVSIGLTIEQIPTVGVVYNPILNELFTGIRGKGAFLNESPIKVSSQTELLSALLATEAGIKCDKLTVDALTKRINSLLFKVRSLRMSGSCALNLCGVACGRLDAYYEVGFGGPWKVAGGAVIVREAGGVMFDMSGEDFDITAQGVVTSNPFLITTLLAALRETKHVRNLEAMDMEVRSLRMSGSCALNLCGVACGRLDAYYEVGFGDPWAVTGGAVIVREAGGVMFDPSGEDFDITAHGLATSNPFLITALLAALRETE